MLDGKMEDDASVKQCRVMVELAEALAAKDPELAKSYAGDGGSDRGRHRAEPSLRPRRSVLYMPGANERALEKADGLPADALILDLEDAVAPDAKAEARDRVCEAAASGRYGNREVTIRVNGAGTAWHDDDLRGRRRRRPGRGRGPQGRLGRRRARRREGARGRRRPRPHRHLGACSRRRSRDAARRGDLRGLRAADRAGHGHQRPRQGAARRARARAAAAAHRPRPGAARRPGHRQGDPRRRLQRHQRRRGVRGRVPAGPPAGVRRQDADPPQPARAVQPGVRPGCRRGGARPGASSRRSRRPRPRVAASSPSTAA